MLPVISTRRLELQVLLVEHTEAFMAGDAKRLSALTQARFPDPLHPPPYLDDVLSPLRDRLRAKPDEEGWWTWLVIERETREAVGSVGLGGKPDSAGCVMLGYSIYPRFQGRGFATEAARGLMGWAREQPGVKAIRATIPPWNRSSLRVAEKLGMRQVATGYDAEVGEVLVLQSAP